MRTLCLMFCFCLSALEAGIPNFQKSGQGPGILLIHGFGGNKEVWAETVKGLSQDHTVIAVDLPGSGGSSGPAQSAGMADFRAIARDLAALVWREGLAPCLIVGHSMGGPIAARVVLEDPKAFRGQLLVDSFLGAIPRVHFEPMIAGLEVDAEKSLSAFFGPMTQGPAQLKRIVADALRVPVPALQAYLRGMSEEPLGPRRAELKLPVLQVMRGAAEPDPAKVAAQRQMYGFTGLPHFSQVHFARAQHWLMWDEPETFVMVLRAFEAGLAR